MATIKWCFVRKKIDLISFQTKLTVQIEILKTLQLWQKKTVETQKRVRIQFLGCISNIVLRGKWKNGWLTWKRERKRKELIFLCIMKISWILIKREYSSGMNHELCIVFLALYCSCYFLLHFDVVVVFHQPVIEISTMNYLVGWLW